MKVNNIKRLRIEKGLSRAALAKEVGVSVSTIQMIENGERNGSRKVVEALANYFNVSVDVIENRSSDNGNKEAIVMDIIDKLIEAKIITDPNNIDEVTKEIIINAVKGVIAEKLNRIKKE